MKAGLQYISFSSPKGGVGRTMTAANVAAVYAFGCVWAGVAPTPVLLVDMDFEAPGLLYYDFVKLGNSVVPHQSKPLRYAIGRKKFDTLESMLKETRQKPIGLVHLLQNVLSQAAVLDIIADATARYTNQKSTRSAIRFDPFGYVSDQLGKWLVGLQGNEDVLSPVSHIVKVADRDENPLLYILSAGDPEQHDTDLAVAHFSWSFFFERQFGIAVLDAIYHYLIAWSGASRGNGLAIRRIILDQDAGQSLAGVANRAFSQYTVIVSGLNRQNHAGLSALLHGEGREGRLNETRVVLSQYKGRMLRSPTEKARFWTTNGGTLSDRDIELSRTDALLRFNYQSFLELDKIRLRVVDTIRGIGVDPKNIFVVDFFPDAVQKEFFFQPSVHEPSSSSYDEVVRLVVSLESGAASPQDVARTLNDPCTIRVLGEYVGLRREKPSGPIGAFCEWATGTGVPVAGVATTHEEIARWVLEQPALAGAELSWTGEIRHVPDLSEYPLSAFDFVAIPVYLLASVEDKVEDLTLRFSGIDADDRIGDIDNSYLESRTIGWREYCRRAPLKGVPLFVDHQLVAANAKKVMTEQFRRFYEAVEFRHFRDFLDPADFLAAARVATQDSSPGDRLIMTLKPGNIAQWYEWQTVVAMFGGAAAPVDDPWGEFDEHLWDWLTHAGTIRATRIYLQLCSYAEGDSHRTDWDRMNERFYDDKAVGMALVWPDAIPASAREGQFLYTSPPNSYPPEECWLLCIPKHRAASRMPLASLEALLTRFLTDRAQMEYQAHGGMTTHRRVIDSLDLWTKFSFLPALQKVKYRQTLLRAAHPSVRQLSRVIINALETLRRYAYDALSKESIEKTNRGVRDVTVEELVSKVDYLWYSKAFIAEIENRIRQEFEKIISVNAQKEVDANAR